jgi:plasmid stabilization system protein ParE
MKVRLSSEARAYVAQEARYLRDRSASAALKFKEIVDRAILLIGQHPAAGFQQSGVPIKGSHRVVIGGYLFDYDIINDVAWIQNVRHSRNSPTIPIEPDADYEEPDPAADRTPGKR